MKNIVMTFLLTACLIATAVSQDTILPVWYIDHDPFGMGKFSEKEWKDFDWIPLTKTAFKQHDDPEDASLIAYTIAAKFKVAWNEEYFFTVVDVIDDKLVNNSDEHYWDDSAELYFDIGNDKNDKTTGYGIDDTQYVFAWNDSPDEVKAYNITFPDEASVEDVECYSDDTNDGYVIEFKIPFTTLKHDNPQAGDTIGFEVIVNDDDEIYDYNLNIDHRILWHANTTGAFADPSLFGTIVLARPPAAVSTPVIIPAGGQYYDSVVVKITTETQEAAIYYTTSGSDPDTSSIMYTGPFVLYETSTVKALAIKQEMTDSEVAEETFTILNTGMPAWMQSAPLRVIPVYSSGQVMLCISNEISGNLTIEVFSLSGKRIILATVYKSSDELKKYLNMDNQPHGIYLIRLGSNSTITSNKFIY